MKTRDATPLLTLIVLGTFIAGIAFAGLGVWLVILGSTGTSDFSFFGQTMRTTSVGISAIFIGATTFVLMIGRTLKTIDTAYGSQAGPSEGKSVEAEDDSWPKEKSAETLARKLGGLSDTQRLILQVVSQTFGGYVGGLPRGDIGKITGLKGGELGYRLRDLERDDLIEAYDRTHGVYYQLPQDVESLVEKNALVHSALKPKP